jgi:hypothetical protein
MKVNEMSDVRTKPMQKLHVKVPKVFALDEWSVIGYF